MIFLTLSLALGGLGMLFLGMNMMTDGLRLAAGDSLRNWLAHSTATRPRAAGSGFLLTALVQSSGVVSVAALGFTNAGILGMRQAAWVIFGSNVGTTLTAWIVALIGLNLKVDVLALPFIGIGIILQLAAGSRRIGHIGSALAGFGLLFLGLDFMKNAFADTASLFPVAKLGAGTILDLILAVFAGAVLTALMQSSTASLAVVLTASAQGLVTPMLGAALVIGANVGSTFMVVLASLGATAAAKRLAMVHVCFNVLTACVAFLLLSPLWWITSTLAGTLQQNTLAAQLAVFHTLFNVLGLLLMWPLADYLLKWVEGLFHEREVATAKLQYLDETVMAVPEMGVAALTSELQRVFMKLVGQARGCLRGETISPSGEAMVQDLLGAINKYSSRLSQQSLASLGVSDRLLDLLQAQFACGKLQELLKELTVETSGVEQAGHPRSQLASALETLLARLEMEPHDAAGLADDRLRIKASRQMLRAHLLHELQAQGGGSPVEVAQRLASYDVWERVARQMTEIAGLLWKPQEEADESMSDGGVSVPAEVSGTSSA